SGRIEEARGEARAIARIASDTDWSMLEREYIPVQDILKTAEQVVLGRAALYAEETGSAVRHFQTAVDTQARISYMEPPYWYYPARQSLAAALLLDGQAARAEYEFQRTLVESPDNAWAFWGLMKAREAQGDRAGMRSARALWKDRWTGGRVQPELKRL
ncbi:MAG: hypothetical protein MI723_03345, partial [Caulobacterales bacterium]|nr:hypothetical protein [Caulobacterales bacterium]